MDSNKQPLNILEENTNINTIQENEEENTSIATSNDIFICTMHDAYIELVKLIEMQRNDTDKQTYDEQIDICIRNLSFNFDKLLIKYYGMNESMSAMEVNEYFKKIQQKKKKYKQLYNEKCGIQEQITVFQRDANEAFARLKVEYENYKRNVNNSLTLFILDLQKYNNHITDMFNSINPEVKK